MVGSDTLQEYEAIEKVDIMPMQAKEDPPGPKWRDAVPQIIASCIVFSIVIHPGVCIAYSAIMLPQLQEPNSSIPINQDSASWIASSVTIATPVGSLVAGPLMDWVGRRATCLLTCGPLMLSYLLLPFAQSVEPIYASRVLAGVGSGLTTAAIVYVSEVSDPVLRPMLLCLNSVAVALGILLTSLLGLWLSWRAMAVVNAALVAGSALLLLLPPESPPWLLNMAPGVQQERRASRAGAAVRWLNRSPEYFDACWRRLLECSRPSSSSGPPKSASDRAAEPLLSRSGRLFRSARIFWQPTTARPLLLLSTLFLFQQAAGTYVIIFYAVPLFKEIGGKFGTVVDEFGVMVIMSAIRFVMSIVTAVLSRRLGRRTLMMLSGAGMGVSALATGLVLASASLVGMELSPNATQTQSVMHFDAEASATTASTIAGLSSATQDLPDAIFRSDQVYETNWLPPFFIVLFVLMSSLGFLVIPWTLISELLPLESRGMGGGLMVCVAYLLMFGVVKSFPYVMDVFGPVRVFYLFSSVSLAGAAFVYFFLPETLGKNFKEIEEYFSRGWRKSAGVRG